MEGILRLNETGWASRKRRERDPMRLHDVREGCPHSEWLGGAGPLLHVVWAACPLPPLPTSYVLYGPQSTAPHHTIPTFPCCATWCINPSPLPVLHSRCFSLCCAVPCCTIPLKGFQPQGPSSLWATLTTEAGAAVEAGGGSGRPGTGGNRSSVGGGGSAKTWEPRGHLLTLQGLHVTHRLPIVQPWYDGRIASVCIKGLKQGEAGVAGREEDWMRNWEERIEIVYKQGIWEESEDWIPGV